MRKILLTLLIFCSFLLLTACSPWQDNFEGTYVYYYLQNDSSRDLYYVLEDVAPSREADGVVEVGMKNQIAWTQQIEVSGHPFSKIKVYDNADQCKLLFETDASPYTSNNWILERIDQVKRKYNQTLILTDEKLCIVSQ